MLLHSTLLVVPIGPAIITDKGSEGLRRTGKKDILPGMGGFSAAGFFTTEANFTTKAKMRRK